MLNTEEALRGGRTHFEVLNFTHMGASLSNFAYYELPAVVKKYDIDLVVGLGDHHGYIDYYACPMTSDGIPAYSTTKEYLERSLSGRAWGVGKDLIKRCKALKIPVSEKQGQPGDGQWDVFTASKDDPQMQDDLKEMTGKRLWLLNEKLKTMKTSEGTVPQLVVFYVPVCIWPNDYCAAFWGGVCEKYHLKYIDLNEPFGAFKISYYPTSGSMHYSVCGDELIARLLSHYLVEDKDIPF